MTARVSASAPSGPHMCPEVRIMAGIEASTMTSLGTCRLVIPLSELTIASRGPSARPWSMAALISAPLSPSAASPSMIEPRPLLADRPAAARSAPYVREHVGQEGPHHVTEDDRVGHLHHGGLEVHREEHVLGLGAGDLLGQEGVEGGRAQDGGVDDLALQDLQAVLEDGGAAVGHELDGQGVGRRDDHGLLVGAEVVLAHGGHVGLGVGAPGPHRVRVLAGVVLDGGRGAAVGVPLAQNGVHRAALDAVVAGARVALLVGGGLVGVVGEGVALALQLGDGRLELRDRRRDVGQLDDVGLGRGGQLAELGERVADPLVLGQQVVERGDDAARQRDVTGLHVDPRGAGEGLDHREEGVGRQHGRLVGQRVDDLGHGGDSLLRWVRMSVLRVGDCAAGCEDGVQAIGPVCGRPSAVTTVS